MTKERRARKLQIPVGGSSQSRASLHAALGRATYGYFAKSSFNKRASR